MQKSAGLLMYRRRRDQLEVLLAHPGGPYFANKDDGAWTVPKGLVEGDEPLLETAQREFTEETSFAVDARVFLPLGHVRLKAKVVYAWAVEGDCDPATLQSNTFELEWPPRSGKRQHFPEVDRADWFELATAREKINAAQAAFLDRLVALV